MALKKLRNKGTISLDDQIIRWRERLRKEGLKLGRHTEMAKGKSKRYREELKDRELVRKGKKDFFS